MADGGNDIENAYSLLNILKSIVAAERLRAENNPLGQDNIALGLAELDQSEAAAKAKVMEKFDALQVLLDHFSIFHMVACFECEAKARIGNAIGEARAAIRASRDSKDPWPENLVRKQDDIQSLQQIGQMLSLSVRERASFAVIRNTRNNLSHGVRIGKVPSITAEEAKNVLVRIRMRIK